MNRWAGSGIPFLFILDFELEKPLIFKLADIDQGKLLYDINGMTNRDNGTGNPQQVQILKYPEKYEEYLSKFNKVTEQIRYGNSYLVNLTCCTPISLNLTLKDVFQVSRARYKIWYEERFVCFSPEAFITIREGVIRSFPMKGTIDASLPDAEKMILEDKKERAEHYTIVDLIRNDLNTVSKNVRVERFRYMDTIVTNEKKLLQVSSEVCGDLDPDYPSHLGDILYTLLPAGSVSGAPKRKTAEIIASVEDDRRGYYTGVLGIFDGFNLDCGVMIRFMERKGNGLYYRSGGGITSFSDPLSEYREMIDKIYVPII